jgi:signal transduction histidine kinase
MSGFGAVAASKELNLELELPPPGRLISADFNLIHRLIDNLLNNAIKFTFPGTMVKLTITYPGTGSPRAIIQVADQGQGVPPEHREAIFEKFNIGELKRNGVQQTGLGLAFCKMVAEAHGGRLYVTENNPRGALFVAEI